MKDKNLPALVNPMNNIMMNGMPNLPEIIQSAMPKFIPPARFEQNPLSLAFGNMKVGQLEKRSLREANIAKNTTNALVAKLDAIHAVVTFSARIADSLGEYEHKKNMRSLLEERCTLENRQISLQNAKLETENNNLGIEGYKLQAEATMVGWEAKMSELEYNIKMKQLREMEEGE